MFAIVDRSQLSLLKPLTSSTNSVAWPVPPPPTLPTTPGTQSITPASLFGTVTLYNGVNCSWSLNGTSANIQLGIGSALVVDPGASQEIVVISDLVRDGSGNITGFKAFFNKPHGPNFGITVPGNPGPQPLFTLPNPNNGTYAAVLPYFTVIE
jgi:hypothetical protein